VKIAVCTPLYRDPSYHYTRSLMMLTIAATKAGADLGYLTRQGSMITLSRNMIAEEALNNGFEWLLWLDADHSFPPSTLHRLLGHGLQFIGCNYRRRSEDDQRPTAGRVLPSGGVEPVRPGAGIESVDVIGFGVCLIHRKVFETVEKPWFAGMAEDYGFCVKAAAHGFAPFVDHELSKEIGHVAETVLRFP
jgi:hypothetical protein